MADNQRTERAGSFASSSTETATLHELTKLDPMEDSVQNLKSLNDEERLADAEEDEKLLPASNEKEEPPKAKASFTGAVIWMVVNTLATIGIVSLGKPREKGKKCRRSCVC